MANVKRGATVVFGGVVGVGRKIAGAAGVAVSVIQGIVSECRKLRAHSNAAVDDELVLAENAVGFELVDRAFRRFGALTVVCRIGGVDIIGEKGVDAAGVQIGYG